MITGNLILFSAFSNSSSLEISKYCAVLTPYSIKAFFILDLSLHIIAAFSGSPVKPKESQVFPRAEIPVSRQQVATPSNLRFAAFLATSSGFAIFIKHTSSARGIPGGLLSGMVPTVSIVLKKIFISPRNVTFCAYFASRASLSSCEILFR